MFFKRLLFLLFSWKWRIWRLDFIIWLIIWFILFFIIQFSVIFWFNEQMQNIKPNNIPNEIFAIFLLMFLLIIILWYIIFALKKKRMNDLWLTNSIFALNLVTIYKDGNEEENNFWKREIIFKWKMSKVIWIISIIVVIIGWFFLLMSSIQNMLNNNYLVIESKNKIDNNAKIEKIIWKEVSFWNISWGISSVNWITNISVNYSVIWNLWEWKVVLDWNNETWNWKYENFILKIWDKQYNLINY